MVKDIENGVYCVIVVSPEQLMKPGGNFETLFKKPAFQSRILSVICDEAHCISAWGEFRQEYRKIGCLRYMLPRGTPFAIMSATLPPPVLADISDVLQIRREKLHSIRRSNDRSNVSLVVCKLKYAVNSFKDLAFLIPEGWKPGDRIDPFAVFFDNKAEAVKAAEYLKSRLPGPFQDRLAWFISDMTSVYKEDMVEGISQGRVWGLFGTDTFGMVSN
jgi:superfamily II DNA helicase RecQ